MSDESPPTTEGPTLPSPEMHQTTSVLTLQATESAIEEVVPPEEPPPRQVGPRGYWKVHRQYVHPPTRAICTLRILVGSDNAEPVFSFEIGRRNSNGKVLSFNQWRRDSKATEFAFMNSFALIVGSLVARAENAVRCYLATNFYENLAKRPMPEGFLAPVPRAPKPKPPAKKPAAPRKQVQAPAAQKPPQPSPQQVTPPKPQPSTPAPRQRQRVAPPAPRAEAAPQGPQGRGRGQPEERQRRPQEAQRPAGAGRGQDLKSR